MLNFECDNHFSQTTVLVVFLCCQVDFQDAEARTVTERRREEERQRKMQRIYKERVEAATNDMEGKHHLI